MTAPLAPSATTEPTYGVRDWITILHNAARTPPDHPRYGEARQVAQLAVENIDALHQDMNAAERRALVPGKWAGRVVAFGQGASQGLLGGQVEGPATAQSFPTSRGAPPVAGYGGVGFQTGTPTPDQNYAMYRGMSQQADPLGTMGAEFLGGLASSTAASPLVAGLTPARATAVLAGGSGALRGALEPIPGFSRAESAAIVGGGSALGGALLGKIVDKIGLVPIARTISQNAKRMLGAGVPTAEAQITAEAAARTYLAQKGYAPDLIEATIAKMNGGTLRATGAGLRAVPPPEPVAVRPGETVTPVDVQPQIPADRAARLSQADRVRASVSQFQGKGSVLPYYTRGGAAEQASFVPGPQVSPSDPQPQQLAQLQLLARLPEQDFEAATALIPKPIMDQLRIIRAQYGLPH